MGLAGISTSCLATTWRLPSFNYIFSNASLCTSNVRVLAQRWDACARVEAVHEVVAAEILLPCSQLLLRLHFLLLPMRTMSRWHAMVVAGDLLWRWHELWSYNNHGGGIPGAIYGGRTPRRLWRRNIGQWPWWEKARLPSRRSSRGGRSRLLLPSRAVSSPNPTHGCGGSGGCSNGCVFLATIFVKEEEARSCKVSNMHVAVCDPAMLQQRFRGIW